MLIRKAKRKYFFLKFEQSKNNMKQTWNTINNILGRRHKKQSAHNKFNSGCLYQWESRDSSATRIFF